MASKAVLAAAQEGCPFCCLLVASLGERSRERMMRCSWVRVYFDRLGRTPIDENNNAVERDPHLQVRWLLVILCSTLAPLPMTERNVDCVLHVAADEGMYAWHIPFMTVCLIWLTLGIP